MKSFNVTLIKREGYLHSLAMSEVAEYLHFSLINCGYTSNLTRNVIDSAASNIILCAHLLEKDVLESLPADTIIFNSEQLENPRFLSFRPWYDAALAQHCVWDYSHNNLAKIPHTNKRFIPLLFCPQLVRGRIMREKSPALLFYGSMTKRRVALMDALRGQEVTVEAIADAYEAARDARMFKARAVLNMHTFDGITTFEPVRCFYPLINGIPIITESAPEDPTFATYNDHVFAIDIANFARDVADLLRETAHFSERAKEKAASFCATSAVPALRDAVESFLGQSAV